MEVLPLPGDLVMVFIVQVLLKLQLQLPFCIEIYQPLSLSFRGYLILPSFFTTPSSDLGSGDNELQEVREQSSAAGQDEAAAVAQTLLVAQKWATLPSTHLSSGWPSSWERRWASCRAASWAGSCSTELSCWLLCSRYRLLGGPAWSQLSTSGGGKEEGVEMKLWVAIVTC